MVTVGRRGGNLGDFHGVVVDEDEGIESEVELLGKGGDVFGLGSPVDLPAHDVFFAENHAGVLLEDFPHVAFLVFGGETENHAGIHSRLEEVLKGGVGLGDFELFGSDFGSYTRPEGGIGIDDEDFSRVGPGWRECGER